MQLNKTLQKFYEVNKYLEMKQIFLVDSIPTLIPSLIEETNHLIQGSSFQQPHS